MYSRADRHRARKVCTVISDLFETGENDERFLLAGIADVLQLSESDRLRKLERKKRRRR